MVDCDINQRTDKIDHKNVLIIYSVLMKQRTSLREKCLSSLYRSEFKVFLHLGNLTLITNPVFTCLPTKMFCEGVYFTERL